MTVWIYDQGEDLQRRRGSTRTIQRASPSSTMLLACQRDCVGPSEKASVPHHGRIQGSTTCGLQRVCRKLPLSRRLKDLRCDVGPSPRFADWNVLANFLKHCSKKSGRFRTEHAQPHKILRGRGHRTSGVCSLGGVPNAFRSGR